MKELNEDTSFKISIKTLAAIAVLIFSLVAAYAQIQSDIEDAKELPEPEITDMEFRMKDKNIRISVVNIEKNVEKLEERMIRMEDKIDALR